MSILERSQWVDPTIDLLVHDIIEYDMKDGGLSIIKEEKLLPPEMIAKMDRLKKGIDRNKAIGKLRYNEKYKDIPKQQNEYFRKYRLLFGESNSLEDDDILAVRKDAIFTKKYCYQLDFGEHIHFAEKNVYQVYAVLLYNGGAGLKTRYEFYWKEDGSIDVKGLEDLAIERYHKNCTISVISQILRRVYKLDYPGAIEYLCKFLSRYKRRELDFDFYRSFDANAQFPVNYYGTERMFSEIGSEILPLVDISYNYTRVWIPLLNLLSS